MQVIEEIGGPAALVGQSMGGHTAMLVAAHRPDLVSRLLLLESDAGRGTEAEHQELGAYFSSWPTPFRDQLEARSFLGDGPLQRAWVEDLEMRPDGLHPRFDADVMVETMRAVAVPRWEEWERVACPTTVVYGSNGMFSEEERSAFASKAPVIRRVNLPGAGHDAHLDSPPAWKAELRAFLDLCDG
ncbi:pimeloyl-ACP methyl ester carboxylesterase [Arthrobacter pigmenti]|uniref:Pimeloyl-ACP methyl ester carboxylesterase n=1 Tax=Arthrobacter pigmenti TaxID=271432 RepID=A0A846RWP1_9MICC|nr:pimeloyl-ACP methyl ester carboxylesterase [Arthrobacter pigmenti]